MKIIEDGVSKKIIIFESLKNILNFDKKDWKHVTWLFKNMIKQFCIGDLSEAEESWIWIKIHCSYKSKRLK